MAQRKFQIILSAALILLWTALCFSQAADTTKQTSAPPQFTLEDFNLIVKYVQSGAIPVLSDSATMTAAISMRIKVDSVVTQKMPVARLRFSPIEANIIAYLIQRDLMALITLKQKVTPQMASIGKTKANPVAKK